MYPQTKAKFVNFKEVKASVNIVQILDHYHLLGGLRKEPSGYAGSCPFCESESPRPFRASEEKNCFNCLSCGTGGNILDFVAVYEECSIREAALSIQIWFGLETKPAGRKKARPKRLVESKEKTPQTVAEEPAKSKPLGFTLDLDQEHEWFNEIGIDPETIEEFGLGYCSKGILKDCIAFPVHDERVQLAGYIGYDLLKSDQCDEFPWRIPKQLQPARLVFNLFRVDPHGEGPLILASNPLDLIHRWQAGERRVVTFLDDTISAVQLKLLESLV